MIAQPPSEVIKDLKSKLDTLDVRRYIEAITRTSLAYNKAAHAALAAAATGMGRGEFLSMIDGDEAAMAGNEWAAAFITAMSPHDLIEKNAMRLQHPANYCKQDASIMLLNAISLHSSARFRFHTTFEP